MLPYCIVETKVYIILYKVYTKVYKIVKEDRS